MAEPHPDIIDMRYMKKGRSDAPRVMNQKSLNFEFKDYINFSHSA